MFNPNFNITPKILNNTKQIGILIGEFNSTNINLFTENKLKFNSRSHSVHASVSIEGNPLNLTEIRSLLKKNPKNSKNTQKEVVNYNNALEYISSIRFSSKQKITNTLICKIQSIVEKDLLFGSDRGEYRKKSVFVFNPVSNDVVYLPPDFKDVPKLVDELLLYINDNISDIDPLILAGIFHKQFELIHPFVDGNGRTGRLITNIILSSMGLDTMNIFSFEKYLYKNITKYFEYVGEKGNYYDLVDIDFTQWIEFFTDGVRNELERVKLELPKYQTRLELHDRKIIDYIEENGSISQSQYEYLADRQRSTRIKDFKKLVDKGILEKKGEGRGSYYILRD
jgi:Fic family protein